MSNKNSIVNAPSLDKQKEPKLTWVNVNLKHEDIKLIVGKLGNLADFRGAGSCT